VPTGTSARRGCNNNVAFVCQIEKWGIACDGIKRVTVVGDTAGLALAVRRFGRQARERISPRRSKKIRFTGPFGSATLLAPGEHRWQEFRAHYPQYDFWLPELGRLLYQSVPSRPILDIGANIGDTAALLRLHGALSPIICVEPSERFAAYFVQNARHNARLFERITLERCFVGNPDDRLQLVEHQGTASPQRMSRESRHDDRGPVPLVRRLGEVAECHGPAGLVKIDTDGYDADVLESDLEYLGRARPFIWVEVTPTSHADVHRWLNLSRSLASLGYREALIFDNFGHFIITLTGLDAGGLAQLGELLRYVTLVRRGRAVIHYLDVCFVPTDMNELADAFRARLAASAA
jgi:FkbM family methyltransferase